VELNTKKKRSIFAILNQLIQHLHSTFIVNIRFDAGKTPLSAIHSTVRGKFLLIDGINHILLLSGGTKKNQYIKCEYKSIILLRNRSLKSACEFVQKKKDD